MRTALVLFGFLVLAAPAASAPRSPRDSAAAPTLLVPAQPDSVSTESEPAPLLIPGRGSPGDTAVRSREERAREQYRLGLAFERQGQPASAMSAFRNATMFDPELPGAGYRLGLLLTRAGQFGEAAKAFAHEVTHHPEDHDAACELGLALARGGESDRAIAQLELLTRHRAEDGAAWAALGFAYLTGKRPGDAERALRRAIQLPPARAGEHRDLAVVLGSQGRDREAREEYRRALALDPRDASVWMNLGNLERRAGRHEQALADYRAAEARDSTMTLALQGQVRALRDLRRDREAGDAYRRWLALTPDDLDTRLEAVKLFDSLGRKDIARELGRDGVRRDPRNGSAHLILGMALQASGDTRAALAEMRKAETLYKQPRDCERVRQLIAAMRVSAADSLRGMFESDSLAHRGGQP